MTETPQVSDESEQANSGSRNLLFFCGAPLALALVLGLFVGGCTYLSADKSEPEPNYTAAITACREAVRPSLKDPDSADFSDETYTENEDGVRWRIRGAVRSSNSYGAVVPSQYECVATWQGEEFTARVTSLG